MKKQKKVFIVPHSHWDREWYFTIEDSNVLLVENIDYLMDTLERDASFTGYVYDAQMSVVEEYLAIRPEEKERLKKLIEQKRILIGPWYTQTDSLLVNKESVIRNLLYGTRLANEMGHNMKVGYLPDIFGQNAYLPSIFKGFEMEYSVLQRGIYTDQLNKDLNFIWKSPDGKSVKANNIFLGYGPGKFLASDDEYYEERLLPMLEKLANLNTNTDNLLLPSGGDQVLVRKAFPKTVAELNEKDPIHEYVMSDYESFMEETWKEKDFSNEIEGELIGCQKSRIHNTIRSQRYDLKKLNYEIENKILYVLEPLATISETVGLKYPQAWLDKMWKLLFDVHAHDSIGGCNSDDTNHDILVRLTKVNRIAEGLLNIMKKQITSAIGEKLQKDNVFVTFNLHPKPYSGRMEAVIFTKDSSFTIKSLSEKEVVFDITEQTYLSGGKQVVVTAEGEKEVEIPGYYRAVIQIQGEEVPAMGYATFVVEEGVASSLYLSKTAESIIANDTLQISFDNGRFILKHMLTGSTIEDFISFENVADAGDSYDFSPLDGDEAIIVKEAQLINVEKSPLTGRMTVRHQCILPKDLNERKKRANSVELIIDTVFEVHQGEEFVRVTHTIDNKVHDHRVRVLVKTPVQSITHSYADQAFSVLERPVINPYLENWKEEEFAEAPVAIYPLENFVEVHDKENTFALVTKGIKEFEVLPNTSEIALTLYRSVGLLGRDDLAWRPGRASGINNKVVYTPDAQLEKQMTFEYSVNFGKGTFQPEKLFALTDEYRAHFATYQLQKLNTFEERLERFEIPYPIENIEETSSLFSIDNENVFMSTCKRAYEGDGIIVRLFNPTETTQLCTVKTNREMLQTNLYEREQEKINSSIEIPAKGYVTVKMK